MSRLRDAFSFRCDACHHEVEVAVCSVGEHLTCPHCCAQFPFAWPGPTADPFDDITAARRWMERELPPEQAGEMPCASLPVGAGCVAASPVDAEVQR